MFSTSSRGRKGLVCVLPDGTEVRGYHALARRLGCRPTSLERHIDTHDGARVVFRSLPDPAYVGRVGGQRGGRQSDAMRAVVAAVERRGGLPGRGRGAAGAFWAAVATEAGVTPGYANTLWYRARAHTHKETVWPQSK